MSRHKLAIVALFFLIFLLPQASAQVNRRWSGDLFSTPLVTALASKEQVRFSALTLAQRIRVEVLSQSGETIYDSDFRPGSRLEWSVQDQQGSQLRDGIYGCIATVEDLSGQVSQRHAVFRVEKGVASFHESAGTGLKAAASTVEEDNLVILHADEALPLTLVSHDGNEGWIESGSGGISLYAGGLSRPAGRTPHVRVTPEGNIGIGVQQPEVKLDVAGLIRTSEGILFPDGTVQKTASGSGIVAVGGGGYGVNSSGSPVILASGGFNLTLPGSRSNTAEQGGKVLANGGTVKPIYGHESDSNTWYGQNAGNSVAASGLYNSFFGQSAGYNDTGHYNTFIGSDAGYANTTAFAGAFFGRMAGYNNTIGSSNTFIGSYAGHGNVTGASNVFVGNSAGHDSTGDANAFFGATAGASNTTASGNSFFGKDSGYTNTIGTGHAFFGYQTGIANTGDNNSFFGYQAGLANTTAELNAFFGYQAGLANTTAGYNAFFGAAAGLDNTTGEYNSFFGRRSGESNTTGHDNSAVGWQAGHNNTTGDNNVFLGSYAGVSNTVENNNSFIGTNSTGVVGITNATAIGYAAKVTQSNSLVLGGVNGVNGATAETNVGIGITNPDRQLTVEGTQAIGRFRRYYGTGDSFTRTFAPAFLFERARPTQAAPSDILAGDYLGKVQFRGRVGGNQVEYGAMAFIAGDTSQNGRFAFLDRDIATERVSILNTGNVGIGTTAPTERLHVVGNIRVTGSITYGAPDTDLPDYVFDPNYRLMRIDELEKFISKEGHLPNVPAAGEIKSNGLNLGDFQMKLLEKIEELTLYSIRQNKALEQRDAEIAALKAGNEFRDERIAALKMENASRDANVANLKTQLAAVKQMLQSLIAQDRPQK